MNQSFLIINTGGRRNATMKKIKEYLEYELAEELQVHHITVIA